VEGTLGRDYFEKLDRFTGFASRGLLSAKVV